MRLGGNNLCYSQSHLKLQISSISLLLKTLRELLLVLRIKSALLTLGRSPCRVCVLLTQPPLPPPPALASLFARAVPASCSLFTSLALVRPSILVQEQLAHEFLSQIPWWALWRFCSQRSAQFYRCLCDPNDSRPSPDVIRPHHLHGGSAPRLD